MAANNPISNSSLTYEDILNSLNSKIASNPNLTNLRESSEYLTFLQLVAGMVDINNWNIEKSTNENYVELLKLRSSAIGLSRNLAYDVARAIPAEATITIRLKGNLTTKNIQIGDVLQIPIYTNFTFNNRNFLLKNTFTYTFTDSDVSSISMDGDNFSKNIMVSNLGESISVIQGEIKNRVIEGITNQQVGQKFQTYRLNDLTFSNQYGAYDYDVPVTTIKVGTDINTAVSYSIDRRSVINVESLESFVLGDSKKVCVIRTSKDENVDLMFGDGQYAALGATIDDNGPVNAYDNIYIQYLSTEGANANQIGVLNKKLTTDISVSVDGSDLTGNIEFIFNSNIIGGADMEDTDSILVNAPNIFYSLDRLVSKRDYTTFLKSLTSPINVKNALSWGEQDEQRDSNNPDPIRKLCNVILFSCLGSMYNLNNSPYTVRDKNNNLDESVLDFDFDEYDLTNQNYFNVYTKQNIVEQIQSYETSANTYTIYGDRVSIDIDDFKDRYCGGTGVNSINYILTSDTVLSGTELTTLSNVIFKTSAVNNESDIANILSETVADFTNGFPDMLDYRGDSVVNSNYGNPAFPNILFTWDAENSRFKVEIPNTDSCYIKNFYSTSTGNIESFLGLANKLSSLIFVDNKDYVMTDKILKTVEKLNDKGQITAKHVYISPIIHNMRLTGKIYVNKLSDKDTLTTQINDAIYKWADRQADFRKDIYISNIIEIIESFTDVIHANVKFEAMDDSDRNTDFFNTDSQNKIVVTGSNSLASSQVVCGEYVEISPDSFVYRLFKDNEYKNYWIYSVDRFGGPKRYYIFTVPPEEYTGTSKSVGDQALYVGPSYKYPINTPPHGLSDKGVGTYTYIKSETNWESTLTSVFDNATSVTYSDYPEIDDIITKPVYSDERDIIYSKMSIYGPKYYNDDTLTMSIFWKITSDFYYSLPATNEYHTPFRDSIDFMKLVSIAFRDNVATIQKNLLDESGNIVNYTKGNEIVKINNKFTVEYK